MVEKAMKVLIADLFSADGIAQLKEQGFDVTYNDKLSDKTLEEAMKTIQPEILVVRSTKVTPDIVKANPKLEFVIRAGQGFNTIDTKFCAEMGVFVSNCPGKNSIAVAELAMGLMLSIDRRIPDNVQLLREGKWAKGDFADCTGMQGRTVGLLGYGNIGSLVATRCQSFGMKVIAWDIFIPASAMSIYNVEKVETADEVCARADIISIHLPAIADTPTQKGTMGLVNTDLLKKMKPNAVFLNTSRAELLNEEDMMAHLEKNKEFFYGCDVLSKEPSFKKGEYVSKLGQHPQVYSTHHIGASTKQSEAAIGKEAVRMIGVYGKTRKAENVVNMARGPLPFQLTIKLSNRCGVLSLAMGVLTQAEWKIEQMNTIALQGRMAIVAEVKLSGDVAKSADVVAKIKEIVGVIDVAFIQ